MAFEASDFPLAALKFGELFFYPNKPSVLFVIQIVKFFNMWVSTFSLYAGC
jgi:hypothetical protein